MKKKTAGKIIIILICAIIFGIIFIYFSHQNKIVDKKARHNPKPTQSNFTSIIGAADNYYLPIFNIGTLESTVFINTYSGIIEKINLKPGFFGSSKYKKGLKIKAKNSESSFLILNEPNLSTLTVTDSEANVLSFEDLKIGDSIKIVETVKMTGQRKKYRQITIVRE